MTFPFPIMMGSTVTPGSQEFTTAGSHNVVVPEYNTITIRLYGGGGEGGSYTHAGSAGGASTFNGLSAGGGGGGAKGPTTVTGGSGGTQSGGDAGSSNGNAGANGTASLSSGKGGDNPGPAGGAGGSSSTSASGNPGSAPGAGGSGGCASWQEQGWNDKTPYYYWVHCGYGGGGSGAYLTKTYLSADSGAPTPGATLAAVVGAGGDGGGNGGAGAAGRVVLSWT